MSYFTLLKDINAGKIAPLYVLYGKESYFIENVKNKIITRLKPLIGDELTSYDLEEVPIQEVIVDAEIVPFLSEKKLIIAHNPTFLLAKQGRLPFSHDVIPLESYLKNPPEYTTLIIIAPYEKLDNRKKITKLLMKQAEVLVGEPVKQYEIKKWITQIGKDYSITFTNDAISIIESELSENLSILHNEIEKLAHFVGENGKVTKQIALDLISVSSESSALQLVDAVLERNLSKAIKIYKNLEKVNEEPIAMIALLAFQFRIILQVKLFKEKGYLDREILRELKTHPYVIKLATKRGRRFSISRLEHIMNKLAETDTIMKRGKMEKSIAFELLLYDLIEMPEKQKTIRN